MLVLSYYPNASGGFRLDAWDYLHWKHVSPITNEKGEVIAAKLRIYAEEPEEYYTFITTEAYFALKDWMVDNRRLLDYGRFMADNKYELWS
jgi:hypothetical protein